MAKDKLKLLYLGKILMEETDAAHPMNAAELSARMEQAYGCTYERRTIYSDIKVLQDSGMKIEQKKGSSFGYYVGERDFELPELKLLVDAVQSSKFITKEKSEKLIRKLEGLTSHENAKQLQRQVFIYNRIKAYNDAIYKNVDAIHSAIHDNKQISFKYCEWTVKKELAQRKGGADYIVSPWALTWDDENYYLVGFEDKIKHYRVDKMQEIQVREDPRQGGEQFAGFDLAAFARKTFGMYGGQDRNLTLEGRKEMAGVVIDRFGMDIMMHPWEDDKFHARVTVTVSPQFFGWLAGLGKGVTIYSPADVKEEYREYLKGIIEE